MSFTIFLAKSKSVLCSNIIGQRNVYFNSELDSLFEFLW